MKQRYFNDTRCAAPDCLDYAAPGKRGFCVMHYFRAYRHNGNVSDPPDRCAVPWCNHGGRFVRGYCLPHYYQWRRGTLSEAMDR